MLPFKRRRRRAELLLLLAAALAVAALLLQHSHAFQQPVSAAWRRSSMAADRARSRRRMGVQRAAMAVESDMEEERRDGEDEATSLWWQPAVPTVRTCVSLILLLLSHTSATRACWVLCVL